MDSTSLALGVGNANDFAQGSIMRHLLEHDAQELNGLLTTRNIAKSNTRVKKFFEEQKRLARTPGEAEKAHWFKMMKVVLWEIDKKAQFIPETYPFRFLDMGCCPGGFSSFLLSKNRRATGVGMSLEPSAGGHEFCLEDEFRPRLDLILGDLTYFQLGSHHLDDSRFRAIPDKIQPQSFYLVILDGHHLSSRESCVSWETHRLLISQLIIALSTIEMGGSLVVKLTRPENSTTARILYMLDQISGSLMLVKPLSIHQKRGTFYAVAKGIGYASQGNTKRDRYLSALKEVWMALTVGGKENRGRCLEDEDLDFIVTKEEMKSTYTARLRELAETVWFVQDEALVRLLAKMNGT